MRVKQSTDGDGPPELTERIASIAPASSHSFTPRPNPAVRNSRHCCQEQEQEAMVDEATP